MSLQVIEEWNDTQKQLSWEQNGRMLQDGILANHLAKQKETETANNEMNSGIFCSHFKICVYVSVYVYILKTNTIHHRKCREFWKPIYLCFEEGNIFHLLGKVIFVIQIRLSAADREWHTMASSKERPLVLSIGIDLKVFAIVLEEPAPWLRLRRGRACVVHHRLCYPTKSLCFGVNVLVTPRTSSLSVSESESVFGSTVISLTNTLSMTFSHHLQVFGL